MLLRNVAPYVFSLVLQPKLRQLQDEAPEGARLIAQLDDVYLQGPLAWATPATPHSIRRSITVRLTERSTLRW